MKIALINLILCFTISLILSPVIIKWLRRLKFGQSILVYVEQHKTKSGTPTMGGIIFIISSVVGYLVFLDKNNILSTIALLSLLFFGVLGFLDDFIKIKFQHNEGLKPYQKIIGQFGIAIIIAVFIYNSGLVGGEIILLFSSKNINLSFWIIPFVVLFYIAVVNSVNLIDGLDGLCAGVSTVVIGAFVILLLIIRQNFEMVYLSEIDNIIIISLGVVGSILGFICFNGFPAKVFMGDTGSLALGGFIASIFALTKQYLLICVVGVVYVLTTISVIMQVISFKLTKKRIFKMSPIHHHFEADSHEAIVTRVYVIMTIIISILTIILYI